MGSIKFLSQMLSWGVTILLIRLLSPEDYGMMAIALAYKLFVSIFFDLSIGEAILQKQEIDDRDTSTAFWICMLFAILLYILTWDLAHVWAGFFGDEKLVDIIRVIGLSLIFLSAKEIPQRLLARRFEFKRRSQFEFIAAIAALVASLTLALGGYGVWALVIGELAKDAVLAVLIIGYTRWWPKLLFSLSSARALLRYGLPVTWHYMLEYVSNKSDSLIVGRVLGQETLGYYTVAMTVSRIPVTKGIQIIQQVMFPLFSTLQRDIKEFQRYYYHVCYVVAVMFFPVFFGILAIAPEIVEVILSSKWLPSLFALQVFTVLGLLLAYSGIFLVILKARGNTKDVVRYSVISAILLPASFLVSANYFGLNGVAISWLLVYPVLFVFLFRAVAREVGVSIASTLVRVRPALIGATLMLFAVVAVKSLLFAGQPSIASMAFGIAFGGLVYTAYFWFFSRHTFADMRSIWTSLRSK
ncbi:MAG: lipopolysaccharide biosynthesis protein [Halioglobus sp.]|nr:lipopolysaccharide biosynthesis protein [Halioglobus sp.]